MVVFSARKKQKYPGTGFPLLLALLLTLILPGPWGKTWAFTCSSTGGSWATAATWTNCNGTTPQAADTAEITAGTVTLNTNATISGLTLSGGTLALGNSNTNRTLTVNGNLSVASGATVNVNNNTATHVLNLSGNLTNNGTLDLNLDGNSRCTANFTGVGAQTLDGNSAGTTEFYNVTAANGLTINKTGAAITQTGTLSITGPLAVQAGTLNLNNTATVNGTTTVNGTLGITNTTGTKIFTGLVTINSGATWNNSTNEAVTLRGGLTNSGTFTAGTGVHTFDTNSQNIGGSITIPNLTVTGVTLTNTGTLSVSTALSGTGGLTNATGQTLRLGGTSGLTTLTATAANNTVEYNGAGAQTVKTTNYHHLTVNKTANIATTAVGTLNIAGNLTVQAGTLNLAGTTVAVSGPTNISGILGITNTTGTKTFTGPVTIHSGGTWNNSANEAVTLQGGLTHNGAAFTAGSGIYTFDTNSQSIGGASPITIPSLTVTAVTLSNTGALTVSTALSGTGTFSNGTNATLTLTGTSTVTTLTANAASNTVNYNGAAQTVRNPTGGVYHHLTLNGSGVKTMPASTLTITGNFTMSGTPTATALGAMTIGENFDLGAGTSFTAGAFNHSLAGNLTRNGTFTAGTSTFTFNGTFTQTVTGATIFNNLTINNAAGLTLAGNVTAGATLTLTAGKITTGANFLIHTASCVANPLTGSATKYVNGNLRLTFPSSANATCPYPMGDASAYTPISVTMNSTGGTLTGKTTGAEHPQIDSSVLDSSSDANRYWTLGVTGDTLTPVTYNASFTFVAADLDSGAVVTTFKVNRYSAGSWLASPAGSASGSTATITGQTALGDFATGKPGQACFSDNFDGTLTPNWSVGRQGGTFTPLITGSRLRLTDASLTAATWATLQRIFPGAGNKVTAEFDHYAYGGTGADGIAVILSNAAIPPVAGAFGGSMGYAQKGQTPVSDCTVVGGCPGFAGGWMGIALDEYGSYSTNTEGRVGGSTSPVPDAVAIRGSGSGMSGYRYLIGTGSLSPIIDNNGTATPPHRYRITVDHTDNIHAWVSVERDTTGGGTNYTTLLGCAAGQTSGCNPLDVKDAGYSQDPVPANWYFSFTGASGGATNIHEFDSLKVCTSQGQVVPTLHHIRLEHDGQACTGSSNPASITVKACADATCSSLYLGSVTVDLNNVATWSADPVTFSGGQATLTLTRNTVGTVTLGTTSTTPTASSATRCFNGTTETCSLTFGSCVFDVIETGAAAYTPIYTKLSETPFNLDVLSLSGVAQTVNRVEIVDASSGLCSTYASLADSTTAVPSAFTANQRKSFAFSYGNAARDARIRVTYATNQYSCSSDNFAIRPQSFTVTSTANQTGSSGTPVFRAGLDTFPLTATALPGYDGMPKLNATLLSSALPNLGLFGAVAFPNATKATGAATATGFTYSEAGNFKLGGDPVKEPILYPLGRTAAVYDDGFTAVDANKTLPECSSDFNNGPVINGRYGCMFGSIIAGPFGRFVPHHFTVVGSVANACPAGSFTYMGQPFTLFRTGDITKAEVVEARNAGEVITKNYAAPYAPGTVNFGAENADNGTDLSARFAFYSAGTYPALSGSWTSGVFTLTGNDTGAAFRRPTATTPDATWGPFDTLDLGLTVIDNDVSTLPKVNGADMNPTAAGGPNLTYKKFTGSPLRMRYGRLRLANAFGPETEPVIMSVRLEYYNGANFALNTQDSCTNPGGIATYQLDNTLEASQTDGTILINGAASTTLTIPIPLAAAGLINLRFSPPGAGKIGNTNVTALIATPLPWLLYEWDLADNDFNDNPFARANFGIYRGNDRIINWREIIR